ncbi:site-specific integrase [Pseudonocardia alni]|uniref:Site-specific recombinase XerD n=1 Tax=Pseudonocardia alni TaxID=33907 RepID=A0A852W8A1_PSEA5|nr:site-specific integrase [Pseudonocardia antarctica]NYG05417.1 site-specific recombinase XerD [Pseudonocardia antarctica]
MGSDEMGQVVPLRGVAPRDRGDQVLGDMLTGWRHQQLSRNLSFTTIDSRARVVARFIEHCNEMPWAWTVSHVDEFFGDLRAEHNLSRSTVRAYQNGLRMFCDYLTDPRYGWDTICEQAFGTHPSQVVHDWNSAGHHQDNEQDPRKRAFTRDELQAFFDRADQEVTRIRELGRKGWLPAFRDAVLFKVAYAWGLRRNEVRHLQTVDFSRNPHAREFGRFGQLQVRYGKAHTGSAPKRRSVLTVRGWSAEVVEHWITNGLPLFGDGIDLFPTERGTLVSEAALGARFRRYRDELGLDDRLDMHSFRRSYVTHLLEDGVDAMFVQHQVGHEHASTTAIYSCVSSDYRTRTLRHALDTCLSEALLGRADTSREGRRR